MNSVRIPFFFASFTATTLLLTACGGGGSLTTTTPFGTKQMGVVGKHTSGRATATDVSGNIYIAGATDGGLDSNILTGTLDFFLTKYDATGKKVYTRQMGVAGAATAPYSVATDINGNVYVAGETYGGLDNNILTGTRDFFLTKYDAAGNKIYTKQMGAGGVDTVALSVATDKNGNVYVAGYTYGGLDGHMLTGNADLFLIKYNAAGNKLSTKQVGVLGKGIIARSVATDVNGNVYVGGDTDAGLDGNTLIGWNDYFLIKYDASGTWKYTRQMGVPNNISYGYSIAVDTNGNAYVTGPVVPNYFGSFLDKYDATGTLVYTQQLGSPGKNTVSHSLATDKNNNIFIVGETNDSLDGNIPVGTQDFFITKLDKNGSWVYTRQMGVTNKGTYGNSVATDANGDAYVTGFTEGGLDGNILTGINDFFLVKFNNAGIKQ